MSYLSTAQLKRTATLMLVVGVIAVVLTVGAYVVIIGSAAGFTLSTSDGNWSNFGSYVGGVLGPSFAFLAFVAVLVTVWLQAQQLELTKQQSHLEELQRVIATVSKTLDDLLVQPAGPIGNQPVAANAERTVFIVLSAAGTAALNTTSDYIVSARNSTVIQSAKDALLLQVGSLSIELQQLVWCLQEYEKEGGSSTVSEFYKRRYSAVVCWLDASELAKPSERVLEYFKPKDFQKFLRSEP